MPAAALFSFRASEPGSAAFASSAPGLAGVFARGDVWRGDRLAGAGPAQPSGHPALDAELPGGGWPAGALVDVLHARPGIGELALLLPAVAAATARDEWVFLQAPPFRVFAPAWQAAGVRLSCLVVLDPAGMKSAADELWAAEQVLRSGAVSIALLWLPRSATPEQMRRLQVAAESGGATGFVLQDESRLAQASPAPLRLRLGTAGGGPVVHVFKRRGAPLSQPVRLGDAPGRPGVSPATAGSGMPDPSDALACPGFSAAAA